MYHYGIPYYYTQGNEIWECWYGKLKDGLWKVAGSDKKIKVCKDSKEAGEEAKKLNARNGV